MTTAPTPSEAERLAELIEKGPQRQGDALIATTLRRLQADNERLQGSLEAQRLISDRAIALAKELEARKPLPPMEAIKLGMEAQQACRPHSTGTTNWAFAMTRFYECRLVDKSPNLQEPLVDKTANLQDRPASLIASREVVADGPVRVTRLHLTEEGRASLTSKATGPLPGIIGGSS